MLQGHIMNNSIIKGANCGAYTDPPFCHVVAISVNYRASSIATDWLVPK